MSGVEIELSVQDGASDTPDMGSETEAGDSRAQASRTIGGPSRIEGQKHCVLSKKHTKHYF